MADKETPRHIAPRLASGLSRVPNTGALPEQIKRGLRLIAARENQSVSWVLEQIIYAYFGFAPPQFMGTREAGVVNPVDHVKVVKRISRDKAMRPKVALTKRATVLIERRERDARTTVN